MCAECVGIRISLFNIHVRRKAYRGLYTLRRTAASRPTHRAYMYMDVEQTKPQSVVL